MHVSDHVPYRDVGQVNGKRPCWR